MKAGRDRDAPTDMRLTCGLGARNEVRSVAIHIDLKPFSTRAWPTGRTHKFIVDGPCRSNARCSRTMLVIFSSIVSVPELAAAQSFVASTIIVSRARRMRAARCLQSRPPMLPMLRAPGGASTGWWWRGGRRCHRAASSGIC